jgi:hypothetical protein
MSGSTPDSRPRPGHSDVYWRRRAIALAAAIGVLTLIAWTVNGALGGAGNAKQAADTTHSGKHGHSGVAAAAATSAAPSAGAAAPTAAATVTPRPTGQASAGHSTGQHSTGQSSTGKHSTGQNSTGKHSRHHAGQAAGQKDTGAACAPGSVVLSLFTTKYRYLAHQAPRFQLDVVSTAARPCSFDVGTKHVQLVIKAGGERQVWDSADCVRTGQRMERLTRGVPAVLRISWDRKTSAAGCRSPGQAARPGTYTATARSGALHSQSLIFVLAGRGIAVP